MQQQNYKEMPLSRLRKYWSEAWGLQPHKYISREMLIVALMHKIREANGCGLNHEQKAKLQALVKVYKRNKSEGSTITKLRGPSKV
jgi:hypothetical protein